MSFEENHGPDYRAAAGNARRADPEAISLGPLHGYGVLLRIQQVSRDKLQIQQGSLYPALYRLEHQGLIASEWGVSENKRRAKYYRLTAAGRPCCGDDRYVATNADRSSCSTSSTTNNAA